MTVFFCKTKCLISVRNSLPSISLVVRETVYFQQLWKMNQVTRLANHFKLPFLCAPPVHATAFVNLTLLVLLDISHHERSLSGLVPLSLPSHGPYEGYGVAIVGKCSILCIQCFENICTSTTSLLRTVLPRVINRRPV